MLTLEERRTKDAGITRLFLAGNAEKALKIAALCAQGLQALGTRLGGEYYLKGSNSIALLKGENPVGDWDFQFKPNAAVYADWQGHYAAVDTGIKELLLRIAKGVEGSTGWIIAPELFLSEGMPGVKAVASFTVGESLKDSNYREVAGLVDAVTHRVILEDDGVKVIANGNNTDGPIVYVNYSIPGFILYRMAYVYHYQTPEGKYSLKSELIDISVPRPGSGEVYLSQEGVVTHFRINNHRVEGIGDVDFRIPGWGYHFYENLNLLQEITLGVSGSPDKRNKRRDRGNEALGHLSNRPGEQQLDFLTFTEVFEDEHSRILGFFEIMTYSLENIPVLRNDLLRFLKGRYGTIKVTGSVDRSIEVLANFDFMKSKQKKTKDVEQMLRTLLNCVEPPASVVVTSRENVKILSADYKVVSPLSDLNPEANFPLLYVLIEVNAKAFGLLNRHKEWEKMSMSKEKGADDVIILRSREGAGAGCQVTDVPQSIRFYFHQVAAFRHYLPEECLQRIIFESQRKELVEAFQKD